MLSDFESIVITIAEGASLSDTVDLEIQRLHRIEMPAAWTAAALSFRVSDEGQTWRDLFVDSGEYAIGASVAAASRSIVVDQEAFFAIRFVQLRSGLAAAPVAQLAERGLILATSPR